MELIKNRTESAALSVLISRYSVDELLDKEWLLTNSRGGFASGSVIGCNTRRYHGLLVGAHTPPANRIAALSNCLETVTCGDRSIAISVFEFDRTLHPRGYEYQTEFRKNLGVHFDYELEVASLTKSIYLLPDSDIVALVYDFSNVSKTLEFSVRPFAAMRDFHALQSDRAAFEAESIDQSVVLQNENTQAGNLALYTQAMRFEQDAQWWRRFLYRVERSRGQDCFEDLWSPGRYSIRIDCPRQVVLWAALTNNDQAADLEDMELDIVIDDLRLREKEIVTPCTPHDPFSRRLFLAAEQFIPERTINNETTPTILAGYPWFLDWGRDTFIALEGLCLSTGRPEIAWGVLNTFAHAVSEGMIPNRFDDYGNPPHYNSIDASLWFVHAAFAWLNTTGDAHRFTAKLLPAVNRIMESYRRGTRFGIRADSDKLITGGDAETQLTWMDAKFNGVSFTPRYGKAVEINALWYSNLCQLAKYYRGRHAENEHFYSELASHVAHSFVVVFWNEQAGYLNDCVLPDGTADASLRPNQILAVSLPHSPLNKVLAKRVVAAVERELLTPRGLRSLAPSDARYKGHYGGPQGQRDAAYHQGTVWGWLIGPFIDAYLKVHDHSSDAKRKGRTWLAPLMRHLEEEACIGSISEIFDGDAPHAPRGAFAQAWSVAETLRAWQLVNR
jgi:predicted glycogen debranching enzyme